jgi:hypothetical protein
MKPVNIIVEPADEAKPAEKKEEKKPEKKELSPGEEALAILARYEEGTPPRKFGYED